MLQSQGGKSLTEKKKINGVLALPPWILPMERGSESTYNHSSQTKDKHSRMNAWKLSFRLASEAPVDYKHSLNSFKGQDSQLAIVMGRRGVNQAQMRRSFQTPRRTGRA